LGLVDDNGEIHEPDGGEDRVEAFRKVRDAFESAGMPFTYRTAGGAYATANPGDESPVVMSQKMRMALARGMEVDVIDSDGVIHEPAEELGPGIQPQREAFDLLSEAHLEAEEDMPFLDADGRPQRLAFRPAFQGPSDTKTAAQYVEEGWDPGLADQMAREKCAPRVGATSHIRSVNPSAAKAKTSNSPRAAYQDCRPPERDPWKPPRIS
jgi:hypothetical protein